MFASEAKKLMAGSALTDIDASLFEEITLAANQGESLIIKTKEELSYLREDENFEKVLEQLYLLGYTVAPYYTPYSNEMYSIQWNNPNT